MTEREHDDRRVDGYCPMGCGRTLFLSDPSPSYDPKITLRGGVTCSFAGCPRPTAVDELLADSETEHIAIFDEHGVGVQHPLRERLDGALFACLLFEWLRRLDGPPYGLGRFRVRSNPPDPVSETAGWSPWTFERLE